jgi:predicted nuclease of predicted toxin-antitoxin system
LPAPAKDSAIWQYAYKNECTIVTQDVDFLHLLEAKGFPPKVILIKTGNISTKDLEQLLVQAKYAVDELHDN